MSRNFRKALLVSGLALGALSPGALAAKPTATHQAVLAAVDQAAPGIDQDAMAIWSLAEVGFQEVRSSQLLQSRLAKAGFTVKAGVAGMPTAFVASYRNGPGPVIAILAEFDALPGLSQQAVATKTPAPGRDAGHGCGHNLFGAASVGSGIALAQWMKANHIKGEIRVYGAPAEEGGSGKVYMVRDGLFDDVDLTIHWHPGNANDASQNRWLANISGKFRFHGLSAHASGAPERGRSALDGVQVMDTAVEFLREHVPDGTRIHYVITDGGKAPNVVPDFAEVYYYVRSVDPQVVKSVWARIEKAAQGAALATETTQDVEITGGTYSMLPNDTLGRRMDRNLRELGGITLDARETAFATAIRSTFAGPLPPLDDVEKVMPYHLGGVTPASSDVSDVSWTTPTVGVFTATFVPGSPGHSWQTSAGAGTSMGVKGAVLAAKAMALTAADALTDPALLKAAKAEFAAARGPDFHYKAMLGDRAPKLDYRKNSAD